MGTYFVTGGTGFIGRHVVARLASEDRTGTVYLLVRDESLPRFERLIASLGHELAPQVVPVAGDIERAGMGITEGDLPEHIDHVIHLAAVYDMDAPEDVQRQANVDGTARAVELAAKLGAVLHHVSSIAVAGDFEGDFAETDFEVEQGFPSPYHRTKYEAEKLVRQSSVPWQIYRPSIVVGDSLTGEIDKIDGPYYFFPILQWMSFIPHHLRIPLMNLGDTNVVPVDFVAAAIVALVTADGTPGRVYHLANPKPQGITEVYNAVAPAFSGPVATPIPGGGPLGEFALRIGRRNEVRAVRDSVARQLGIPPSVLDYPFFKARLRSSASLIRLHALGVTVPPLSAYGPAIFSYWANHLDPSRNRRDDPRGPLVGKHILLTGGSSGIGREAAKSCVRKGAHVFILARQTEELAAAVAEIDGDETAPGMPRGTVRAYRCDVTDPEAVRDTVAQILAEWGHVDVLVNNAGRSIRRATINSVDRAHDYQRTMAVNYFGAVYLILELLPHMIERKSGHVVNVSSIGVQVRGPRFAAYVASKSALEAFSEITAAETMSDHVTFTNIHMPLTRTRMIAPTEAYDHARALTVEKAAAIVVRAIVERPRRIDTPLGTIAQFGQFLSPRIAAAAQHQGYLMSGDSDPTRERGFHRADDGAAAGALGRGAASAGAAGAGAMNATGLHDPALHDAELEAAGLDDTGPDIGPNGGRRRGKLAAARDGANALSAPLMGVSADTGIRRIARKTINRIPGINW